MVRNQLEMEESKSAELADKNEKLTKENSKLKKGYRLFRKKKDPNKVRVINVMCTYL